jgi:hypothetical protein
LDARGFELYRDWVKQFTTLATRKYLQFVEGAEHFLPNERMREGYHKDHIFSVRDGFENDVPEHVISCPPNICMIQGKSNLAKGRKSNCTLGELLAKYDAFLQKTPEWPEVITRLYEQQQTFICPVE